ncbi:hypothetical protein [Nocardia sp. IFM 10818]
MGCASKKKGTPEFWDGSLPSMTTFRRWYALRESYTYTDDDGNTRTAKGLVVITAKGLTKLEAQLHPEDYKKRITFQQLDSWPSQDLESQDRICGGLLEQVNYEVKDECPDEPGPDPDPDPEVPTFTEEAQKVAALLGWPLWLDEEHTKADPEAYPIHRLAQQALDVITPMVRAYVRGNGFNPIGYPNEELAAVITTASARFASNPSQLEQYQQMGPFTGRVNGFRGWELAEIFVLNRYRKRAIG